MAANKDNGVRGISYNGKIVKWAKTGDIKPTEAIVKPGQKATGLAKSNVPDRFSSNAKTPVHNATTGLRGTGTPLNTSLGINPLNKGQIVNAALTALSAPRAAAMGTESITKGLISKVAQRYSDAASVSAGDAAFNSAAKGIEAMREGGKIKNVTTPMGKTIASSKIMNEAQVAAAKTGLTTRAANIATAAETGAAKGVTSKIVADATKVTNAAKNVVRGAAAAAAASQIEPKKKPKKK